MGAIRHPVQLTPLPFETRLADLSDPILVEHSGRGGYVVIELTSTAKGEVMCITHRDRSASSWTSPMPPHRELGDALIEVLADKPLRAFTLPGGRVEKESGFGPWSWRAAGMLLAIALAVPMVILVHDPRLLGVLISACVLGAIAAGFIPESWVGVPGHRYIAGDGTSVPLAQLRTSRLNIVSREFNQNVVGEIKKEYGRLLTDLTYRIENSAMFDVSVPETSAFNAAMIRWDDNAEHADDLTQAELAARVRATFDAARANAETLGIDHLPQTHRSDGIRAAKAARLAAESAGGEREAALRTAERLLSSMALYYLPKPTEAAEILQGKVRRALPGRREVGE